MLNEVQNLYKCTYGNYQPFFISSDNGSEKPREVANFVRSLDPFGFCADLPLTIHQVVLQSDYLFWSDKSQEESLESSLWGFGFREKDLFSLDVKTLLAIAYELWQYNHCYNEIDAFNFRASLEGKSYNPSQLPYDTHEFINSLKNIGIKEVTVECWADHGCMISERIDIDTLEIKSNVNKITF